VSAGPASSCLRQSARPPVVAGFLRHPAGVLQVVRRHVQQRCPAGVRRGVGQPAQAPGLGEQGGEDQAGRGAPAVLADQVEEQPEVPRRAVVGGRGAQRGLGGPLDVPLGVACARVEDVGEVACGTE
jgi:hypothetical protein